jgi:transcription elongation factor Elf1
MSSPNISETIDIIERHIGHIPYNFIWEFTLMLFSHNGKQEHIFASLYNALSFEYVRSRMKLKLSYEETTRQLVAQAKLINEQFSLRLRTLLDRPEFIDAIKRKMVCNEKESSIDLDRDTPVLKPQEPPAQAPRSKTQFNLEVIKETPKTEVPGFNRVQYDNKLYEKCENLIKNMNCFCENPRSLSSNDDQTFKCFHCNGLFHTSCMKKKVKSAAMESCAYCFLEKMSPLRKVVKPLFVGLMRKTFKKHQVSFFIPELEPQQKMQVRCVRLKDGAQTACLFPDVACITLNQQRCC